jgi:hypothetical protein
MSLEAIVANSQRLQELSVHARNALYTQRNVLDILTDAVSKGTQEPAFIRQALEEIKKNTAELEDHLENLEREMLTMATATGHMQEMSEVQGNQVHDIVNGATVTMLTEYCVRYSADFWEQALKAVDEVVLQDALGRLGLELVQRAK